MKRNGPGGFEKEASAKYTKKGTNMNRKELSQNHWKYYLMLEKRFVESIEFVELHEDNFDAFSNGYALLIQAIGQSWILYSKSLRFQYNGSKNGCRLCTVYFDQHTGYKNQKSVYRNTISKYNRL